jgi:dynein heavy chain 1
MLEKAKSAVSNIKTSDLNFIKALANPPVLIKLTMEAVVTVVKNTVKDWSWPEVKKEIGDAKFIKNVTEYNTDSLKKSVRAHIDSKYLGSSAWVVKDIYKASSAAGPLAEWVDSQLKFGRILS